jgi:type IV pilus assembly protein PilY1
MSGSAVHAIGKWVRAGIAIFGAWTGAATAAVSVADFAAGPPTQGENASPMVMLVMSRDEQLFKKAYNDYTALDVNPGIDYTYTNSFDYYGYFASNYCYDYDSSAGMFKPLNQTTNHDCSGFSGSRWSGNFLNWASMTRMDVVRRVLYGGARSSDPNTAASSTSNTVLERAMLPTDIHAFAKVYAGSDMNKFTPYTYSATTLPAITLCNVSGVTIGNVGAATSTVTYATGLSHALDTATYPPLILVAKGNNSTSGKGYPNWAASESRQCVPGNGASAPASIAEVLNARVEVCVVGKDATDATRCRKYANGNYKPVGLLQRYGESHSLRFGLLSGSYAKKDAGGVLRRNIGYFAGNNVADQTVITADDEINLTTGQFAHDTDSINGAAYPGIISTLNRLRISQYDFGQGRYEDCRPAGISITDFKAAGSNQQKCRDWGNPLAEAYLEALNYISGQTAPSSIFNADDSPYITKPSPLPQLNTWIDPYADIKNRCAKCAIVVLSTGLNTFDADHFVSNIASLTQATLDARTNTAATAPPMMGNVLQSSIRG